MIRFPGLIQHLQLLLSAEELFSCHRETTDVDFFGRGPVRDWLRRFVPGVVDNLKNVFCHFGKDLIRFIPEISGDRFTITRQHLDIF